MGSCILFHGKSSIDRSQRRETVFGSRNGVFILAVSTGTMIPVMIFLALTSRGSFG